MFENATADYWYHVKIIFITKNPKKYLEKISVVQHMMPGDKAGKCYIILNKTGTYGYVS